MKVLMGAGEIGGHLHVERDFVAGIDGRPDGEDAHIGRQHLFQIGKDFRPAGGLEFDQLVEEHDAVERDFVAGLAHLRVEFGLFRADRRELEIHAIERDLRGAGFAALGDRKVDQIREARDHQERGQGGSGEHGAVMAERGAREIDGDSHAAFFFVARDSR